MKPSTALLGLALIGLLIVSLANAERELPADGEGVAPTINYSYKKKQVITVDDAKACMPLVLSDYRVSVKGNTAQVELNGNPAQESVTFSPFENVVLRFTGEGELELKQELNQKRMITFLTGLTIVAMAPVLVSIQALYTMAFFCLAPFVQILLFVLRDARTARVLIFAFIAIVAILLFGQLLHRTFSYAATQKLETNGILAGVVYFIFVLICFSRLEGQPARESVRRFVQVCVQLMAIILMDLSCQHPWFGGMLGSVVLASTFLFCPSSLQVAEEAREREEKVETTTRPIIQEVEPETTQGVSEPLMSDEEIEIEEDDEVVHVHVRPSAPPLEPTRSPIEQRHESIMSEDEEEDQRVPVHVVSPPRTTRVVEIKPQSEPKPQPQPQVKPQRASVVPDRSRRTTRVSRTPSKQSTAVPEPAADARAVYTLEQLQAMSNLELAAALRARGINRPVVDATRRFLEKQLMKSMA
eukprot:m.35584 g.35584  ORF g.35584 m.35584 type:complete len:471 (+) comp11162_c0_seq1:71-1483(+)